MSSRKQRRLQKNADGARGEVAPGKGQGNHGGVISLSLQSGLSLPIRIALDQTFDEKVCWVWIFFTCRVNAGEIDNDYPWHPMVWVPLDPSPACFFSPLSTHIWCSAELSHTLPLQ